MQHKGRRMLIISALFIISLAGVGWKLAVNKSEVANAGNKEEKEHDGSDKSASVMFNTLHLSEKGLALSVFELAINGYQKIASSGMLQKPLLAIADMSQPSGNKRLYIIDVQRQQLLIHTLVAHGRNSGDKMANHFSNIPSSLQSSLGFFVTEGTYTGSNGLSMRLRGLEKGFNDKALARAIVMHGAAYVNEAIAEATGRIGRSWGCPAVSQKEHKQIIELLKGGSCLFIYAPDQHYLAQSAMTIKSEEADQLN